MKPSVAIRGSSSILRSESPDLILFFLPVASRLTASRFQTLGNFRILYAELYSQNLVASDLVPRNECL
jgi:hypothetical protein